jgi:phosphatidylinositol-3-phosphatase
MPLTRALSLSLLPLVVAGYGTAAVSRATPSSSGVFPTSFATPVLTRADASISSARASTTSKVLIVVEENHSFKQMRTSMPYLARLSARYAFATGDDAITHPSLPNYLALTGGSTFGVRDDNRPSYHRIQHRSVFDQALHVGKTATTYAESMPSNCYLGNYGGYVVKHNPWAYYANSRGRCMSHDVPLGRPTAGPLQRDIHRAALPNVGLVVPNLCHDAHDCSLAEADRWLHRWLPRVLAGRDFRSGRLTVVVTADEDDKRSNNDVLAVVMHAGLPHQAVTKALTHYSLLGYVDHVLGVHMLRRATGGFARAFGL